jgi:peroxiredoxin
MADIAQFDLHPGDAAPEFALPGTDGRTWRLADFQDQPFLLVVFWCNHCPYVRAWESRLIEIGRQYGPKGVGIVLINANDAVGYPDDRMELMIARARDQHYPFPYLRDDSQTVAHAYGARVTPHPMLFDQERRLVFQGRIDDNSDHPERVHRHYLADALDHALAGTPVAPAEQSVLGCSVKWRSG